MESNVRGSLTPEILKSFHKSFYEDPKNVLALNACSKNDPFDICLQRSVVENTSHVYNHKVDEIKPVTSQKSSGRCWIFAALNVMRIPFAKKNLIDEFEFSQSYLFFWDKIERCNFYLHTIVEVLRRGEDIDGRLMGYLLNDPIADGGQWHMFINLINRYGLVPKKCYPETFCCESSFRLNNILKIKLREYARDLHLMVKKGSTEDKVEEKIVSCMEKLYRIIAICLGVPPETFTWEYYDKNKCYYKVGPITPQKFYEEHVKPLYDVNNKVCFVNDPRPDNPYNRTYTVDCLGNMVGGCKTLYLNQEVESLMKFVAASIKSNEAVWFGCDVAKMYHRKLGVQDLKIHDYNLLFGVDVNKSLTKAERLLYGDSQMTHAMVFTAVTLEENGEPIKFRVENSWGDDKGEKGYLIMTADWFREFCFEVVIDKQHVPKEILDALNTEPKVLPAWDPMGSLAL